MIGRNTMHRVAISRTGLYIPPETISNAELVNAFNQYAQQENATHAADIEAGAIRIIQFTE